MRIGREADYAIRVVLDLSMHPEAHIREIAHRQRLSPSYVGRISQRLAKDGILDNRKGRLGCLLLAAPPDQITLLEVIEAIEGPVQVDRCWLAPAECGREASCPVYHVGQGALLANLVKLNSITLASLINGDRQE